MLIVRIYKGDRVMTEKLYEEFPLTIGRDSGSDICILNETVSSQHARISVDAEGSYLVEDLGSLNGIHCRGKKVPRIELRATTALFVGEVKLEVTVTHSQKTKEIRPEVLERIRRTRDPKRLFTTLALAASVVAGVMLFHLRVLNTGESTWLSTVTVTMLAMALFFGAALLLFTTARPLNREVSYLKIVEGLLMIVFVQIILDALCPLIYYLGSLPLLIYGWLARVVFLSVAVVIVARLMGWAKTRTREMIIAAVTSVLVTVVMLTTHLNLNRYGISAGNTTLQTPLGNFVGPTKKFESLFKASDDLYAATVKEANKKQGQQKERRDKSQP